MEQNKTGKYLKYAIGEILLVVIGILIAIQINNKNQESKSEAKIDAIFENVLKELESDINQSASRIYRYQKKDSIAGLVLKTDLTYDDYARYNISGLWNLVVYRGTDFKTSKTAYEVLMANVNLIPEKYSQVVRKLNILYNDIRPNLEEYSTIVKGLVDRNITDLEENYEWYSARSTYNRIDKEEIDYMLNNYKYKNKVVRYRKEALLEHRFWIENYRYNALIIYEEIAILLKKTLEDVDFIINDNILEKYVGTYSNNLEEQNVEIYYEKRALFYKGHLGKKLALLPLKAGKEFTLERSGILKFDENEQGLYMTIYVRHEVRVYPKVKSLDK